MAVRPSVAASEPVPTYSVSLLQLADALGLTRGINPPWRTFRGAVGA
ncbi:MAG TPA: hypothetical protein VKB55_12275 [Nocardioidaceae bacterium]|nr:hypothetical protein [Nocardioidaceae bacterium]